MARAFYSSDAEKLTALKQVLGDKEFERLAGKDVAEQLAAHKQGASLGKDKLRAFEALVGKDEAHRILAQFHQVQAQADMAGIAYKGQKVQQQTAYKYAGDMPPDEFVALVTEAIVRELQPMLSTLLEPAQPVQQVQQKQAATGIDAGFWELLTHKSGF